MIYGIYGEIGSGKSWKQMHFGLELANTLRKKIVTNFAINLPELKKYAARKRYWWVVWLCDNGQIAVVDAANNLEELLDCKNSVVMLDEAGIFLNAREFSKTPKSLLMDLAQSRKDGNDLLYAAQFDAQVDKQFRLLTQWFIHCAGVAKTDKKTRRPKLYWKYYAHFKGAQYQRWQQDIKAQTSVLRTWMIANHMDYGMFTEEDASLFQVFNSFARLEQQGKHAKRHLETVEEIVNQTDESVISMHKKARDFRKEIERINRLWYTDKLGFLSLDIKKFKLYLKYKNRYNLPSKEHYKKQLTTKLAPASR